MRSWLSRSSALRILPAALSCAALVAVAGEAHGQATKYQYAAKYVCGTPTGATVSAGVVAPGKYFTSVNVHNPGNEPVAFLKLFDIALPNEQQGGRISEPVKATLKPQEAFEIECADILKHLDAIGFAKGFVTLESPSVLDVVAVYTASASTSGGISAMFMERVPHQP
jgi:hypothetical protein